MVAEELTIGSIVYDTHWLSPKLCKIIDKAVKEDGTYLFQVKYIQPNELVSANISVDWLEGAPLTEDVMKENDFGKEEIDVCNLWRNPLYPEIVIQHKNDLNEWIVCDSENDVFLKEIKYVHELQNLCTFINGAHICGITLKF